MGTNCFEIDTWLDRQNSIGTKIHNLLILNSRSLIGSYEHQWERDKAFFIKITWVEKYQMAFEDWKLDLFQNSILFSNWQFLIRSKPLHSNWFSVVWSRSQTLLISTPEATVCPSSKNFILKLHSKKCCMKNCCMKNAAWELQGKKVWKLKLNRFCLSGPSSDKLITR